MTLIDASFVGRTSSVALAALGPAGAISDSATNLLLFLSIAATNLIASAHARRDKDEIRQITSATLFVSLILGSVMGSFAFTFAKPLCTAYCSGSLELVPYAMSYVRIRAIAIPAAIVQAVSQALCLGIKDGKNHHVN